MPNSTSSGTKTRRLGAADIPTASAPLPNRLSSRAVRRPSLSVIWPPRRMENSEPAP